VAWPMPRLAPVRRSVRPERLLNGISAVPFRHSAHG
jgi:hypothetical protein